MSDTVHGPAGGRVGSLVDGAAAVSVGVGFGTAVVVPLVEGGSVWVPAVPEAVLSFFLLKIALSLSMASRAVMGDC
jgi:hypothetical protein